MTRTQLSTNFYLEEFAVSATHPDLADPVPDHLRGNVEQLAQRVLQPIRDLIAAPITINSGYRSPALNRAIGGSPTSQHLAAAAADFTTVGLRSVFRALVIGVVRVPCGQCIFYPSRKFIHIALPSKRYPVPSWHIHEPSRGFDYRPITPLAELERALASL